MTRTLSRLAGRHAVSRGEPFAWQRTGGRTWSVNRLPDNPYPWAEPEARAWLQQKLRDEATIATFEQWNRETKREMRRTDAADAGATDAGGRVVVSRRDRCSGFLFAHFARVIGD